MEGTGRCVIESWLLVLFYSTTRIESGDQHNEILRHPLDLE